MIEEITLTKRVQTPTPPNEWCYQDQGENYRYFTKRVLLGKDAEPWPECTAADRDQWEQSHPQPEPEPVEPEQARPANEAGVLTLREHSF